MFIRFLALVFAVLLFAGCEGLVVVEEKDSYPDEPLNVDHIPDAVPMVEPRTAAGNTSPYVVNGKQYRVLRQPDGYIEEGIGSWYGQKFHGERTANGEIYNMYGMTAAHPSLPIPSYVRVTNLQNNKTVIVRVNDRGPFHEGRIIDLTYSAAKKLGYVEQGTARVKVEYIDPLTFNAGDKAPKQAPGTAAEPPAPAPKHSGGFQLPDNTYLQVGAFSELASADALKAQLREFTDYPIHVLFPAINEPNTRSPLFRVQVGPFTNNADLQSLRRTLMERNFPLPHVVYRNDKAGFTR